MKSLNGSGKRKTESWIETFIAHTDNLEAPGIFRRWAAICSIASVLEQKVWLPTSSRLYPNLYSILVGHPGTGKTRTIRAARSHLLELPEFHLAPTSMTAASLIDSLLGAKRIIVQPGFETVEYNSMAILADELGAFMHQYDDEMVGVLSAFYDPDPYGHNRRGKEIKIKIQSPQINILAGSTPSNLLKFVPEGAWDQGFTSRMILIFSDERIMGDDFAQVSRSLNPDLVHDLKIINALSGEFQVTPDYRNAVQAWRALGEPPVPSHPKLLHYNNRRRVHLYKLSMVSALDRSNNPLLTKDDFNRALGWLLEAELYMADIFKAGAPSADSKASDEIYHYVLMAPKGGISEAKLVRFASERVPAHSVMRVIENMARSNRIKAITFDKVTGQRQWVAIVSDEA
jgi:hypothetical protein